MPSGGGGNRVAQSGGSSSISRGGFGSARNTPAGLSRPGAAATQRAVSFLMGR